MFGRCILAYNASSVDGWQLGSCPQSAGAAVAFVSKVDTIRTKSQNDCSFLLFFVPFPRFLSLSPSVSRYLFYFSGRSASRATLETSKTVKYRIGELRRFISALFMLRVGIRAGPAVTPLRKGQVKKHSYAVGENLKRRLLECLPAWNGAAYEGVPTSPREIFPGSHTHCSHRSHRLRQLCARPWRPVVMAFQQVQNKLKAAKVMPCLCAPRHGCKISKIRAHCVLSFESNWTIILRRVPSLLVKG